MIFLTPTQGKIMLKLAMKAHLPLVHIQTDDVINIEAVLTHLAGVQVKGIELPEYIANVAEFKLPGDFSIYYTLSECKTLAKLYSWCAKNEKTIVFVNTEKTVLHFDGAKPAAPRELILELLSKVSDTPEDLLKAVGGLTLKDVGEVAQLTLTREDEVTIRGLSDTRRQYRNLQGITPVETGSDFYQCPTYLESWLKDNSKFFLNPVHPSLVPRGLLFDGNPGTGKTAGAKHIAETMGIPLYHLDMGAIKGKYVGESEHNLLSALQQADEVEPCVLLLDEIEKIFVAQGDSGVTTSLLSQLLWWLQEHKTRVFTIMTTNDKGNIPKELYREGRIDTVMRFEGIETNQEAVEFMNQVFESVVATIEGHTVITPQVTKAIQDRVDLLFADLPSVPQVKLVQAVHNIIKQTM